MKCPKCKGYGYYEKEEDGIIELIKCECQYTNEEWLKQCNTKELAELIFKICERATWDYKVKIMVGKKKKELIVEWLKQPHTTTKE